MTVAELIAALSKYPADDEVYVADSTFEPDPADRVEAHDIGPVIYT